MIKSLLAGAVLAIAALPLAAGPAAAANDYNGGCPPGAAGWGAVPVQVLIDYGYVNPGSEGAVLAIDGNGDGNICTKPSDEASAIWAVPQDAKDNTKPDKAAAK